MLLSFRVENHKSIRDEQQVLLTPVYDDATPEEADWEALTATGIFGANASGKSNVLDALGLMQETVRWSMRDNEPGGGVRREPFALSNEAAEEPSVFVVDLMLSGVRHTYGFAVDDDRVVEEWLYSYPRRRKRVVFERDEESFTFGEQAEKTLKSLLPEWSKGRTCFGDFADGPGDALSRAASLPEGTDPNTGIHRLVQTLLQK